MMGRWAVLAAWMVLISSSCAVTDSEFEVGPSRLTYLELHDSPETFKGQPVTLGGKVLHAKRLKAGTRIEILQLPLDSSFKPTRDLRQSQGRFIAMKEEFLDPATIPSGTFITVSGNAAGSITLPLDETEYLFPIVEITNLRVWPTDEETPPRIRPYPYMLPGPYWYPYWRPWPYW